MSNRPGRKMARNQAHARTSARVADHRGRQQRTVWIGITVIVVLGLGIGLIGALSSGGDDDSEVALNGEFLPVLPDAGHDPAVGTKAPIFVTTDFDDERVVTGSGGGPNDTAKIIAFVAHWCPTCQAEVPRVVDWLNDNELPERVEVIAVSTFEDASRDNHPPSDWFDDVEWPATALEDSSDSDIAAAFGMTRVPGWVVLDDFNQVLTRTTGALDTAALEALVELAAGGVH